MKLLVCTQKIDKNDAVLGFFHGWVCELAKKFEKVTVICLGAGEYDVPANVTILSLGKEKRQSRLRYIFQFYKYIWRERKNYDAVFVHMNQEYVLLGWKFWKLYGKKIYLWRNHKVGNFFTNLAVFFSNQVFCTSKGSYTARFKKTKLMPVGVDGGMFRPMSEIARTPHSVLFLGRLSPVKHVDVLIEALKILDDSGVDFVTHFYGGPTPADEVYAEKIKQEALGLLKKGRVVFREEISNVKTPAVYNSHEVFVNLTGSGSFDKTIIESMLCKTLVLVSNQSLVGFVEDRFIFKEKDPADLARKLRMLFEMPEAEKEASRLALYNQAQKHSLQKLIAELVGTIK